MTAPVSTGRCAMRTSLFRSSIGAGLALLLALPGPAVAIPPPPDEMQAAHQVRGAAGERDWQLDPAVFTDLSPVTAAEPALRLPADQRDDAGPEQPTASD